MGTTQRIIPGVTGEPNWPNISKGVTSIAKTVQKELQTLDPRIQKKLEVRRKAHSFRIMCGLLRAGGGRTSISRGKSSTVGRAGLRTSKKLASFFGNVGSFGLREAFRLIGLEDINGKSIQQIVDYLILFCSDNSTGMDETAAAAASNQLFEEICSELETPEEFEAKLNEILSGDGLTNLLCHYFGYYLFEHLSQRFSEKISQMTGEPVCEQTFEEIKNDILGRIDLLNLYTPVQRVDWQGEEGKRLTESIFDKILYIYEPTS